DVRAAGKWAPGRPGPTAVPVEGARPPGAVTRRVPALEPVRRWRNASFRERPVGDLVPAESRRPLAAPGSGGDRRRARETTARRDWDGALSARARRRRGWLGAGGHRLGVLGPDGHLARMAAHQRAAHASVSFLDDDALA